MTHNLKNSKKKQFIAKVFHLGFTLIEVLIAIFIFAIVATIISAVLHTFLENYEVMQRHANIFHKNTFAVAQLQKDFSEIIQQPVYREDGQLSAAFQVIGNELSFTILSQMINPSKFRVRYFMDGSQLIREVYSVENNIISKRLERDVIFDSVLFIHWQYLSYGRGLTDNWPPGLLGNQAEAIIPIPRAVSLQVNLQREGELKLLIRIPTTDIMGIIQ